MQRQCLPVRLPDDVWVHCWSFLSSVDLSRVQGVSKQWRKLTQRPLARIVAQVVSDTGPAGQYLAGPWLERHRLVNKLTLSVNAFALRRFSQPMGLEVLSRLRVLHVGGTVDDKWHLPASLEELTCHELKRSAPAPMPHLRQLIATCVPSDLRLVAPRLESLILGDRLYWDQRAVIDHWPDHLQHLRCNESVTFAQWPRQLTYLDIPTLLDCEGLPRPRLPAGLKSLCVNLWAHDIAIVGNTKLDLDYLLIKSRFQTYASDDLRLLSLRTEWPNVRAKCLMLSAFVTGEVEKLNRIESEGFLDEAPPPSLPVAFLPHGVEWIVMSFGNSDWNPPMLETRDGSNIEWIIVPTTCREMRVLRHRLYQKVRSEEEAEPLSKWKYGCDQSSCRAWKDFGPCGCLGALRV